MREMKSQVKGIRIFRSGTEQTIPDGNGLNEIFQPSHNHSCWILKPYSGSMEY